MLPKSMDFRDANSSLSLLIQSLASCKRGSFFLGSQQQPVPILFVIIKRISSKFHWELCLSKFSRFFVGITSGIHN